MADAITKAVDEAISAVEGAIQHKTRANKENQSDWQATLERALVKPNACLQVGQILRTHGWSGTQFKAAPDCQSLLVKLQALKEKQRESDGVNWMGRGIVCCVVGCLVMIEQTDTNRSQDDAMKAAGVSIVVAMILFRPIVNLITFLINLLLSLIATVISGIMKTSVLVALIAIAWHFADPTGFAELTSKAAVDFQLFAAGGFVPGMAVIVQDEIRFVGGDKVKPGDKGIVHAVPPVPEILGGELTISVYPVRGQDQIKFNIPASRVKVEKNPEVFCKNMRVIIEREMQFDSGRVLLPGDRGIVDFVYHTVMTIRADPTRGQESFTFKASPSDVNEDLHPEKFTKGLRVVFRRKISFDSGTVLQKGHRGVVVSIPSDKCQTFAVRTEPGGGQRGFVFDSTAGDVERDTSDTSRALVGDESITEAAPVLLDAAANAIGRWWGQIQSAANEAMQTGETKGAQVSESQLVLERRTIKPDGTVVEERFTAKQRSVSVSA